MRLRPGTPRVLDPPPPTPATPQPLPGARAVPRTVAAADAHAATLGLGDPAPDPRPPHTVLPAIGDRAVTRWVVGEHDTAHAVGHPDPGVDVLGSPVLGLWFELATSPLLPAPGSGHRHVGVGLVVHHVGSARVGDEVDVHVTVAGVDGRAVWFDVAAWHGDEVLVAAGVHHRVVLGG